MMTREELRTDSAEVAVGASDASNASMTTAAPEAERIERPAPAPWIRPLADYERRETTIVEGLRYG